MISPSELRKIIEEAKRASPEVDLDLWVKNVNVAFNFSSPKLAKSK
jgi:hypothetical protein